MNELDPNLTFDTFVVGPANRLACAAARRAADAPGTSYNPLFVYAASGLGKSHLLAAIAHHAERADPKAVISYEMLEAYLEELAGALEAGDRESLRERHRAVDFFLMDDVQFLAGQPEAQEMLLRTLDSLTRSGKQIVLASDRPPAEIDGLDARLLSRFSGGLIVDIAPPEYETRVAILRRKMEERDADLAPKVAEAIARIPFRNVRELTGALNRVLAIQELEARRIEPADVERIFGRPPAPDEGAAPGSASAEGGPAPSVPEPEWRTRLREEIERTEAAGFAAVRLQGLLDQELEPEDLDALLDAFRADVARLEEIRERLSSIDLPWPEHSEAVLRDPEKVDEAETLLAAQAERARPFEPIPSGATLDELEGDVPSIVLRAAAKFLRAERPEYNPLFVWDRTGGAGELLAAVGRARLAEEPGARVAYVSASGFAEDFIRALSAGVAGAWRERWWSVDLLLLRNAEALSETERAQDEFFHLFEALRRRGGRVVISADRPPSEIARVDDRLRSRFEGGLVLELADEAAATVELEAVPEPIEAPDRPGTTEPPTEPEPARPAEPSAEPPASVEATQAPPEAARADDGVWIPSTETAVWEWPTLDDRIVEELD